MNKKITAVAALAGVALTGLAMTAPAMAAEQGGNQTTVTQDQPNYLNSKMTVINHTKEDLTLTIGAGDIDPGHLVPETLAPGESISKEGWSNFNKADIRGDFWMGHDSVRFEAGNPKVGWPWVEVDGHEWNLSENESVPFDTHGHHFQITRHNDLSSAKDFTIEVS